MCAQQLVVIVHSISQIARAVFISSLVVSHIFFRLFWHRFYSRRVVHLTDVQINSWRCRMPERFSRMRSEKKIMKKMLRRCDHLSSDTTAVTWTFNVDCFLCRHDVVDIFGCCLIWPLKRIKRTHCTGDG